MCFIYKPVDVSSVVIFDMRDEPTGDQSLVVFILCLHLYMCLSNLLLYIMCGMSSFSLCVALERDHPILTTM